MIPMTATEQQEQARALAKPIYEIINRLAEPPTAQEYARMQELINLGADLEVRYNDGNKETLLEISLAREYYAASLFLLRNGADPLARCVQDSTPFTFCALKGNAEVLQRMLDTGRIPLLDHISYNSLGERKTALMCAAQFNHADCAALLIRHGADMNFKNNAGKSAFDYALKEGHAGVIEAMQRETSIIEAEKIHRGAQQPVGVMKQLRLKPAKLNKRAR